jgi:protein SHQ1
VTIHVSPYFLRLHLPGPVLEDDASSANYDPGQGTLTVILSKEVPGQEFPDLDLLAKLLAPPPKQKEGRPGIEVLASEDTEDGKEDDGLAEKLQSLDLDAEKREILEGVSQPFCTSLSTNQYFSREQ